MAENDRGILMYESTLAPQTRQCIRQIGRCDVVIGIPSHRNGRTIGDTVRAVVDGIAAYLYDQTCRAHDRGRGIVGQYHPARGENDSPVPMWKRSMSVRRRQRQRDGHPVYL